MAFGSYIEKYGSGTSDGLCGPQKLAHKKKGSSPGSHFVEDAHGFPRRRNTQCTRLDRPLVQCEHLLRLIRGIGADKAVRHRRRRVEAAFLEIIGIRIVSPRLSPELQAGQQVGTPEMRNP